MPLELAICARAAELLEAGISEFHGYAMAKRLADVADSRLLTAYGTLYRALARLESRGFLRSWWEAPEVPARENRPGRRLYALTALGETALQPARDAERLSAPKRTRRTAPA